MSPSPETSELRRFMRAKPVTSFIVMYAFAVVVTAVVGDMLATYLRLNEIYVFAAASVVWGLALIAFGFWLGNHHGGFAVFVGFIALIGAILFPAMYAARPDLFPLN